MVTAIRIQLAMAALAGLVFLGPPTKAQSIGTQPQNQRNDKDSKRSPVTFWDRVIEMNRAEVQLGHLAMGKAQNTRVKEFAETMVVDHTKALLKLEDIRQMTDITGTMPKPNDGLRIEGDTTGNDANGDRQKSTVKPEILAHMNRAELTREHQQDLDKLARLSTVDFDREFMEMMIRDHRSSLRVLEQESANTSSDTAAIARELLPGWRHHLTQAEEIQKQIKSSKKPRF